MEPDIEEAKTVSSLAVKITGSQYGVTTNDSENEILVDNLYLTIGIITSNIDKDVSGEQEST